MRASSHPPVPARGPWTEAWGYSRAVRVGSRIEVSGTSAIAADGSVVAPGDVHGQTVFVLDVIERALLELGSSLEDVIRTRVFLVDVDDWRGAGRAHSEVFGRQLPASTCVGGIQLLRPELLVEIEATAVVPDAG